MRNAFAVVHTWPDLRNAEYEVLQRVLTAARRVGTAVAIIDNDANVLWSSPELALAQGAPLPDDAVDFVLSMHFESPRVTDAYSYITLWQPIEFYHTFDYQRCIRNVGSHDDLLSCDSDLADHHGTNLLDGLRRTPLLPLLKMFHAVPEPFLPPGVTGDSRLFYVGINWERLSSAKGRFHEVMKILDGKDLTDIYGPEELLGVRPWEGFQTYRGELPFDGESVTSAIQRSGICLALSSAPHQRTGIMSNRLFEGLAGGAAIIANPNPLIEKHFRDVVYLVDDARGEAALAQQVTEAVRRIRSNPEEATRRVLEGQRILREVCSLERSIQRLVAETPARIAQRDAALLADAEVTVILTYAGKAVEPLRRRLGEFARQRRATIHLHVLCDRGFARRFDAELATAATGSVGSVCLHPITLDAAPNAFDGTVPARDRTGPVTLEILRTLDTPFFAFARMDEAVFSDHYASIARAMEDLPAAQAGCSGMVVRTRGPDRVERRRLDSLRFTDFDSVTLVNGPGQVGRFIFRAALLRERFGHLMPLLDGEEHGYFRLAALLNGPVAQTNHASYVLDQDDQALIRQPVEPVDHQRQHIRDHVSGDPRWLDRLARNGTLPAFVGAHTPGAPVRWQDYAPPVALARSIVPDRAVATRLDGEGLHYLVAGFSAPEGPHVWIEAERGVIEFTVPEDENLGYQDFTVVLRATGRASQETGRDQHCTFALNGMTIAYVKVPNAETELRVPLPKNLLGRTRTFRLELTPDHAEQVHDAAGRVVDPRRLSIRLLSIAVMRETQDLPPILDLGELHRCAVGELGSLTLLRGFFPAETTHAWMAGTRGALRFRVRSVPASSQLRLLLLGRNAAATGAAQEVHVTVNGLRAGPFVLGSLPGEVVVPLSRDDLEARVVHVELEAKHAEAVYDGRGEIVDPRLLGAALFGIGLQAAAAGAVPGAAAQPSLKVAA